MAENKPDIVTFYGVDALADAAERGGQHPLFKQYAERGGLYDDDEGWSGDSMKGALEKCRDGWQTDLDEVLHVVESAVSTVEAELPSTHFHTQYGVEGCDVDVDRFLSGEPESMISYPLTETPRVGRVITLAASICYSSGFGKEQIKARGRLLCALVMALSRMGLSTELWVEAGCGLNGLSTVRCLLKGANDALDESRIMFMYAHPSALRRIMFCAAAEIPNSDKHGGSSYWQHSPGQVIQNYPEGTIYLPEMTYGTVPNMEDGLRNLLHEIGIIEHDDID